MNRSSTPSVVVIAPADEPLSAAATGAFTSSTGVSSTCSTRIDVVPVMMDPSWTVPLSHGAPSSPSHLRSGVAECVSRPFFGGEPRRYVGATIGVIDRLRVFDLHER